MSTWRTEVVSPASTERDVVVVLDGDTGPKVERFPTVGYLRQRDQASGRVRHVLAIESDEFEVIPVGVALDDPYRLPVACGPVEAVGVYGREEAVPVADLLAAWTRLATTNQRMGNVHAA